MKEHRKTDAFTHISEYGSRKNTHKKHKCGEFIPKYATHCPICDPQKMFDWKGAKK